MAATTLEENARAAFDQSNPFELEQLAAELPPNYLLLPLYRGYVAASLRQTEIAISALSRFSQDTTAPLELRAQAVLSLAGVAMREGRYTEAVKWLENYLGDYSSVVDAAARQESLQTLSVAKVLSGAPHQETIRRQTCSLPRTRDKAGLSNIPLKINDQPCKAVFDTGANFCVATESAAKRLVLSDLSGAVEVQASNGNTVTGRMAIAHSLVAGGMEFRDVAFLIFKDQDLAFPQIDYAIELIVGFPVIAQFGCVEVRQSSIDVVESQPNRARSNLALESLTPHIAVSYETRTLPFQLDTGATTSEVSAKFIKLFPDLMKDAETVVGHRGGAGSMEQSTQYKLQPVSLTIGSTNISVTSLGSEGGAGTAAGKPYGVIGEDVLFNGSGYALDFDTMHFRLLPQ